MRQSQWRWWGFLALPVAGLCFVSPLLGEPALAPPGRVLSFQALITDGGGVRLEGNHTLDFRVYDVPAAGAPIFSDLGRIVSFSEGVCSTTVGTAGNQIPAAVFDENTKYLGVTVDGGIEMSPRALLSPNSYAFRADRVENEELTDNIDAGSPTADGTIDVFTSSSADPVMTLTSFSGGFTQFNNTSGDLIMEHGVSSLGNGFTNIRNVDGTSTFVVAGGSSGVGSRLTMNEGAGEMRITLDAEDATNGPFLSIANANGNDGVLLSAGNGAGAQVTMNNLGGGTTITLDGDGGNDSGRISLLDRAGANNLETITLSARDGAGTGGEILMREQASGAVTIDLDGSNGSAGQIALHQTDGSTTFEVFGTTARVHADDGSSTVTLTGQNADDAGSISVNNNASSVRVLIDGEDFGGGLIDVRQDNGASGILLRGEEFSGGGNGSVLEMLAEDGAEVIELDSGFSAGGGFLTIDGNVSADVKSAIVEIDGEERMFFCTEGPEMWFEDVGSGKLDEGKAEIKLDPGFLQTVVINNKHPMRVMVTLTDDCNGVFVKKGTDGFVVQELRGGTSNATFDYKVICNRSGYSHLRLPKFRKTNLFQPDEPAEVNRAHGPDLADEFVDGGTPGEPVVNVTRTAANGVHGAETLNDEAPAVRPAHGRPQPIPAGQIQGAAVPAIADGPAGE